MTFFDVLRILFGSLDEDTLSIFYSGLFAVCLVILLSVLFLFKSIRVFTIFNKIVLILLGIIVSSIGYTLLFASFYLKPYVQNKIDTWAHDLSQNKEFIYNTTKKAYNEVGNSEDLSAYPIFFNNVVIPVTNTNTLKKVSSSMTSTISDNFYKNVPIARPLLDLDRSRFANSINSLILGYFPLLRQSDTVQRFFDYQIACFPDFDNNLFAKKAHTGALQVSLTWFTKDDLDLHLLNPKNDLIYFSKSRSRYKQERHTNKAIPNLDIDANRGHETNTPIENIFINQPFSGFYRVYVDAYSKDRIRNSNSQSYCGACGRIVPNSSRIGDGCPYCGVIWTDDSRNFENLNRGSSVSRIPFVVRVKRYNKINYYRGFVKDSEFDGNVNTKKKVIDITMDSRSYQQKSFDAKIAINNIRSMAQIDSKSKVDSFCFKLGVISFIVLLSGWFLCVIYYSIEKSRYDRSELNY